MSSDITGRIHKVNRLLEAVDRYEARLKQIKETGIGANGLPVNWVAMERAAMFDSDMEVFALQTLQSRSFAMGILSEEEASWLYQKLGREMPSKKKFNALPLAERMVIITTAGQLVNRKK